MKKRVMNNKGYSLIELIIVIAIMVILASTLGVALIKYIGKARVTMDINLCTTVNEVLNLYLVEDEDFDGSASVDGEVVSMERFRQPGITYSLQFLARALDDSNNLKMELADTFGCKPSELRERVSRCSKSNKSGELCYQIDAKGRIYVWINATDMSGGSDHSYETYDDYFVDESALTSPEGTTLIYVYR